MSQKLQQQALDQRIRNESFKDFFARVRIIDVSAKGRNFMVNVNIKEINKIVLTMVNHLLMVLEKKEERIKH